MAYSPDYYSITPALTADVNQGYTVTYSSMYTGSYGYYSFNKSAETGWASARKATAGWIQIDLPAPQQVDAYNVVALRTDVTYAPSAWTLQGWDGSQWVTLDSRTGVTSWASYETKHFDISNPSVYSKYKLDITAVNGATFIELGELELLYYNGTLPPLNISQGLMPTSSVSMTNPLNFTDGSTSTYSGMDGNLQWVQLDFGQSYELSEIKLWHYFTDGRKYYDVIIMIGNDPNFTAGSYTILYNNDTNNSAGFGIGSNTEYNETSAGLTVVPPAGNSARYIRTYASGSTANNFNHWVEIQCFVEQSSTPTVPTITITNITKTRLSNNTGFTSSTVTFHSNIDLQSWEARAGGTGHGSGILVGSGTALTAETSQDFIVDNTELSLGDSDYRINVYGQSAETGEWSIYE